MSDIYGLNSFTEYSQSWFSHSALFDFHMHFDVVKIFHMIRASRTYTIYYFHSPSMLLCSIHFTAGHSSPTLFFILVTSAKMSSHRQYCMLPILYFIGEIGSNRNSFLFFGHAFRTDQYSVRTPPFVPWNLHTVFFIMTKNRMKSQRFRGTQVRLEIRYVVHKQV